MQASFTLSQCVKMPDDCPRDGSLTLICRNSRLDIIEFATLRIWSCIFTRKQDHSVKLRVFFSSGKQKKIGCLNVHGYCDHCKTVFEAMACYCYFCFCQEARPLTDQDIERGNKKREMENMRREYIKEKGYKVEEMWQCEWWERFKTDDKIKKMSELTSPTKNLFVQTPL